ncbi:MAG TPA: choice-of-anchor B family protein, partial [Candidatus Eisenbacteria bacterium]|nr:choice-of-anchor B family protein [Candidatus Eisenbacteria bacterium]
MQRRCNATCVLAAILAVACVASAAPNAAIAAVSRNVTLLAHLDNYAAYSACWSYVHSDGREYAILGTDAGTSIVNITNPSLPYEVAFIPGLPSVWREMKQYRNWVYISTEAAGGGIQIVRMTNPESPVLVKTYTTNFNHAHTVAVDTMRALLILNGTRLDGIQTGMRILSLADPENPVEVGSYLTDYVHDSWVRNDTLYASCISSAIMRVLDFANPAAPTEIVSWTYPGARTHSAEKSRDGRYLYACDEMNYGTLKVFDMQNVFTHPMVREITVNPLSIVHNVHVKRDTAFIAWYTEGVRLFDLTDPSLPAEWGYYDTYRSFSGGFHGVWEVAPFYPSGTFIASDIESGLYIFRANPNYGTLRITVRDAGSVPIPGADVVTVGETDSTRTQSFGTACLALAPGSHTVRVRKWGYQDAFVTGGITKGAHDFIDVVLQPAAVGTIAGAVRRASDSAGLEDATIEDRESPLLTTSGSSGGYSLTGTPPGTYELVCDRAGYGPQTRLVTMQPSATMTENWSLLRAAWYDSCDADKGWSLSAAGDNATDGLWVRAEPVGTSFGSAIKNPTARGNPGAASAFLPGTRAPQHPEPEEGGFSQDGPVQPDDDASPGTGFCFVTGNGAVGGAPADGDVDGGKTTLTSPPLPVGGMTDPTIGFRRWYYMNTPGEPDSLLIDLSSDGVNWVRARTIRESHPDWHPELIRVKDYIVPGATVRVRFIAQDEGVSSIVEAAIDDLELHDAALVPTHVGEGTAGAPRAVLSAPRPNPTSRTTTITLRLKDAGPARVAV